MSYRSLEELLQAGGGAVQLARNSQIGPYVYPAVPAEFSNWRDEQVRLAETSALFDQSHHMTDLYVEGPDVDQAALRSRHQHLQELRRQQGQAVRRGQLRRLRDRRRDPLLPRREPGQPRRPPVGPQLGAVPRRDRRLRRHVERDERTAVNPTGRRKLYRFQVQGPTALKVLEKATGGPLPEIKFFNMGDITIAGHKVRALHHGMSGAPGLELFGPWERGRRGQGGASSRPARSSGSRQVGSRVYATNTLESGWIPCPLPAVFTGDEDEAPTASGCRRTATRERARSAAASTPTTSRTTT